MAKRRTNRKLKIVFVGREPGDPLHFLSAVDEALRPNEIEIQCHASEPWVDAPAAVADEVLETSARAAVADVLDEQNRLASQEKRTSNDFDDLHVQALAREWSDDQRARQIEAITKRANLTGWAGKILLAGWRLSVRLVSVASDVKTLSE